MVRKSSDSFLVARENAVRIAHEMLDRKIGICAGCRALTALSLDLVGEWAADRDFRVIGCLDSESDRFPLGSARKFWAEELLEALGGVLNYYERKICPGRRAVINNSCAPTRT
jgi:hypothetical protein